MIQEIEKRLGIPENQLLPICLIGAGGAALIGSAIVYGTYGECDLGIELLSAGLTFAGSGGFLSACACYVHRSQVTVVPPVAPAAPPPVAPAVVHIMPLMPPVMPATHPPPSPHKEEKDCLLPFDTALQIQNTTPSNK